MQGIHKTTAYRRYWDGVLLAAGRRLIVLDDGEVADDLVRDMIEVLASFCGRLYGRRSARNRAGKALACAAEAGSAEGSRR
jgi:putative resolvase